MVRFGGILICLVLLAGGTIASAALANDTHTALARALRKGQIAGEKVTAYAGEDCRSTLRTKTRAITLDWRQGQPVAAIEVNKGELPAITLEGSQGFATIDNAPVANIRLSFRNALAVSVAAHTVDTVVRACSRSR